MYLDFKLCLMLSSVHSVLPKNTYRRLYFYSSTFEEMKIFMENFQTNFRGQLTLKHFYNTTLKKSDKNANINVARMNFALLLLSGYPCSFVMSALIIFSVLIGFYFALKSMFSKCCFRCKGDFLHFYWMMLAKIISSDWLTLDYISYLLNVVL